MTQNMRNIWLWMIPLLLVAFWLGIRHLNADIFWFDEVRAMHYATYDDINPRTLPDVWKRLSEHKWQSPAFYMILSIWGRFTGWSEFGTRMLSLLIGIMGIAMLYRLGRDSLSPTIGLVACVSLISSAVYINYMHELRAYMLYFFLTCLSVWAYWKVISAKANPKPVYYIALFAGFVGLAHTHTMALLTPIALGVYHLIFVPKNRRWLITTGVVLLSAIVSLPWIFVILGIGYDLGLPDRAAVDTARQAIALYGLEIPQTLLFAFSNGNIALLLVLLGFSLFTRHRVLRLLWTWLIIAVALVIGISYVVPAFIHIKYLMAVWGVIALLCAISVDDLAKKGLPAFWVLLVWLGIGIFSSWTTTFHDSLQNSVLNIPREGYLEAVEILNDVATRDDEVIAFHDAPLFQEWTSDEIHWYYFKGVHADFLHLEMVNPYAVEVDEELYRQAVADALRDVPVVWKLVVPQMPQTFRSHAFNEQLASTHAHCQALLNREDIQLDLYAHISGEPIASFADEQVTVTPIWSIPSQVSNRLDVLLGWEHDSSLPPDTYSIALHLENTDGQIVRQADYGLSNQEQSCQWSHINLEGLATGEYALKISVYNWQTLERLPADAESNDDRITIQHMSIE